MNNYKLPPELDTDDLTDIGWSEITAFSVLSLLWIIIIAVVIGLLLSPCWAAKRIPYDANSQSITVMILDAAGEPNTAGVTIANLDLYCIQDGHGISAKVDLAAMAGGETAWESGHGYHLGQGMYRIDLPDANITDANVGDMLHYLIVDPVSGNKTVDYEVEIIDFIDTNSLKDATKAGIIEVGGTEALFTSLSSAYLIGNMYGVLTGLEVDLTDSWKKKWNAGDYNDTEFGWLLPRIAGQR